MPQSALLFALSIVIVLWITYRAHTEEKRINAKVAAAIEAHEHEHHTWRCSGDD